MWKQRAAKIAKWSLARWGMRLMIQLTVPRTRVGVAVVAVNDNLEVFMVRHVFHPLYEWGLPGGWLNKNEAPKDGALRELREETGLTAQLGPAISVQHDPETVHIGIAYPAKLNSGDIRLSHELIEARWFACEALPQPITHHTQLAIDAAVAYYKNLEN
ncbi:NUDIX hydrolase [Candidatus Leptofilum sp.]|uniref:NUDIX hydrolase n=1 Tax=Candidatus Leptofilum sp. TaxID=3241576 RepID=UPI003B5AC41A